MVGSTSFFDIVVSMSSIPSGDNDPTTKDDRTPYEEIFNYFADAVYEATEGAHKIGKVYVYTKGDYFGKTDICWDRENGGHPSADTCGNGKSGCVNMFDVFENGTCGDYDYLNGVCRKRKNLDFIKDDREGGGYTLGHEWGHYTYCLSDEYRGHYNVGDDCSKLTGEEDKKDCEYVQNFPNWPRLEDEPVHPSIMHNQFYAKSDGIACDILRWIGLKCNYKWLNFSIAWKEGGGNFRNTKKTGQHRIWASSGWETLVRNPKNDGDETEITTRPTRVLDFNYFPELANANIAPQNEPTIQLPNSAARSELKVIWMTDKLVYEIVLDKSASMGDLQFDNGQRIINAKKAAKFLVDQAEIGKTAIGVIAFNNSSQEVYPITDIANEEARQNIKDAIDGITTYDGTAIYDAAKIALDKLLLRGETESRVVFLLTDGASNSDYIFTTPEQVIAYYKKYNIPLFTFGYGTAAYGEFNPAVLSKMATETGGKYYYSPVELNDIIPIFNDARKEVSPSAVGIASSSSNLLPSSTQTDDFPVDSTVNQLRVTIIHNGASGDLAVTLKDPNGNTYNLTNCSQSGSGTICLYSHDTPQTGMWQITYASQSASSLNITSSIDGTKKDVITYSLSATNLTGDTIQYPTPILLLASFNKYYTLRSLPQFRCT
jgi:hypothetical protein